MTWLALAFALELGILPTSTMLTYQPNLCVMRDLAGTIYTDLGARLEILEVFYVGGGVRTYALSAKSGGSWFPTDAFYRVELGVAWEGVELYFRHYCIHPVIPFFGKDQPTALWEGAYEELGLRITGRAVLWRGRRKRY